MDNYKYQNFLNYNWNESAEWKQYFSNIFPVPDNSRIEYYKRKFYKLKIDPDFDIHYNYPPPNQTNNHNSHRQPRQNVPNNNNNPSFTMLLVGELVYMLLITYLLLYSSFNGLVLLLPFLIYKIIYANGGFRLTSQHFQNLILHDYFSVFIYTFVFITQGINHCYLLFPFLVFFLYEASENLSKIYPSHEGYKLIVINKKNFRIAQCMIEVLNIFIAIIGVFIDYNRLFIIFLLFQYIKFKYSASQEMKKTFTLIHQFGEWIVSCENIPPIFKNIVKGIESCVQFLGSNGGGNVQIGVTACSIF